MSKSSFIPNSFQTPNGYVDDVMPYLTGEEFKVLIYATRRILGFQKRQDRISISQFTDGTARNGERVDRGTGLSIGTVKKCLESLVAFGLMVRLEENDPRTNEGVLWSLQWDSDKVDWSSLEERAARQEKENQERIAKARSVRHTPVCGTERTPVCGTERTPVCGTERQKTEETQRNTGEKERILDFLQSVALGVFHDNYNGWQTLRRRLEADDVVIAAPSELPAVTDPDKPVTLTITGLSKRPRGTQFTEAEIFEHRYARSFANFGILIDFKE